MKLTFNFVVDTTTGEIEVTNTETGEIKSCKAIKKKSTKKSPKNDENPNPQLILEDNKYKFNSAAVELMKLNPDDRVDIKYEKRNGKLSPVIGKDEIFQTSKGNRITKTYTVSYRGKANAELAQYGNIFDIKKHPETDGIFILIGNKDIQDVVDKEEVELPSDNTELDLSDDDLDLTGLIDDNSELQASDFNF